MATAVRTPSRLRPCASPIVVVVLPSPSGVGVMAVTIDLSTVRAVGETVEDVEADLGLVAAVELDLLRPETHLLSDVGDGTQLRVLGDP